jgi:aspartyl-tRNA(Asn)/glutamyl-tRNA(Gln) amidotransferase subunit A
LFLGGLGTDTGGSVRLPAAWSGISGLKQTFGRVPKSGCTPLGYSFDNIGPMTRSARDCAAMLAVMAGHDESDACSVDRPVDDYVGALTGSVEGLRIGFDSSLLDLPLCDPDVAELTRAALAVFIEAGAFVTEIKLPLYDELVTTVMTTQFGEALAYHRNDMQQRWDDYGRPTRLAIGSGAMMTAADFVQAQRVRRVGLRAAEELFLDYDVIITPTTLVPPVASLGVSLGALLATILTPYWNALGFPAISIPMGLSGGGLPLGLQLAGRPFEESTVLRAADSFQQLTDHHLTESPLVLQMLTTFS